MHTCNDYTVHVRWNYDIAGRLWAFKIKIQVAWNVNIAVIIDPKLMYCIHKEC